MKKTIFFLSVMLAGSLTIHLFSVEKISKQTEIIKQTETENKQLKQELSNQKQISFLLQKKNDSLVNVWKETSKEKIIEKIKIKNNEKYIHYLNSVLDEQLRIFAENLEQERTNYNHWQRHTNSDNNQ
ncbi:hypothetical protein RCZ15_09890 [Capnocytophaga catalasegens]|uniref:Uncharacterized protein n=1 Tax=Capnocytophaga catalasegens TaxID=1004260 RepID=A0AAV5ATX0_9FLAO|nr:hypothetical protein RCZ03_11010 [Capnocytophaga catalasegens]GJM50014.1 hypothetical protein RCZ15_09890 [Capnocytophaga catalasegens]GJM53885.1 hypothetical protein RCZ16_22010 [Capnocytophaga catalasegens]